MIFHRTVGVARTNGLGSRNETADAKWPSQPIREIWSRRVRSSTGSCCSPLSSELRSLAGIATTGVTMFPVRGRRLGAVVGPTRVRSCDCRRTSEATDRWSDKGYLTLDRAQVRRRRNVAAVPDLHTGSSVVLVYLAAQCGSTPQQSGRPSCGAS